jgi:hypothetical protein
MRSLKVLITCTRLEARTGTELYVRDLAARLLESGHRPIIYSPRLGRLAAEIRQETVPVVDDLNRLSSVPDVIHGQHVNETMTALLHFPAVPAVFFCHDWYYAEDYPPAFPRILRYVAVDQPCYDKLVFEHGAPEERVRILHQFVDLKRFQPRPPLPARPRRAAVLCNYSTENEHLKAARDACARAGVMLDVYGLGVGQPCPRPETVLGEYDIVFAKGRAALEALAVGTAVVVYWWRRLGPMVTTDQLERLRELNFGVRAMGARLTPDEFGREIERAIAAYDPADAAAASRRVRAVGGRDSVIDEVVKLYEEAIEEHQSAPERNPEQEARAAAAHLRAMSLLHFKQRDVIYNSTPFRLTEKLLKTPVLGSLGRAVGRVIAKRPPG